MKGIEKMQYWMYSVSSSVVNNWRNASFKSRSVTYATSYRKRRYCGVCGASKWPSDFGMRSLMETVLRSEYDP